MRVRLHHQLALPFAAVAVVATIAATWFAVREVRVWVSQHRQADARTATAVLARAEYATNPGLLRVAAELAGVEIVTVDDRNMVIASGFTTEVPPEVLGLIADGAGRTAPWSCGAGCAAAVAPVRGTPGARVMVFAGRGGADPFTEATVRSIWFAAVTGVVLLVALSQVLARLLTARLERLVDFTNHASLGHGHRAAEGRDDIGRLGAAFNRMLDRLDDHRQALMRSEKLAVAGLMAARVAHDVRNPLSSIKLRTQLLLSQVGGQHEAAESLQTVLRDIGQLETVVSDLLETARPEAPRLEPVDLPALVRTAAEPFVGLLAHRRIDLVIAGEQSGPPAYVDRTRLHRAIVNLLNNAAEATRGGDTITVSTLVREAQYVIEIADDGVGIDPEIEDRLFDPFVSGKPAGIGLGLVNVKAIVDSHGGTVSIKRREPRGTLVVVSLPMRTEGQGGYSHG